MWSVLATRKRWMGLLNLACALALSAVSGASLAEPVAQVAQQLLAAERQALAAERAARLAERAAQKIADAVRAERRTIWLERTAQGLRARGGREYLAARRGADLARRERTAVVGEARAQAKKALETLDGLLETPAALQRPLPNLPEGLAGLSERICEHAARLRAAALQARESLLELQQVHTRLEITREQLTEARAEAFEESLARRRAQLADALDRLVRAAETLTQAAEDLDRAASQPLARGQREAAGAARRWGVGVGIAFNVDVGGKTRIETARIVEDAKSGMRVVRVERTATDVPRAIAEVHYLFPLGRSSTARVPGGASAASAAGEDERQGESNGDGTPSLALGPFAGVQFGDDFVDALGAGLMLGWRVGAFTRRDQLQVGVGYFADPNTRVLGDGFAPDRPPPAGETQVRYKEVTKSGVMVLLTYGF